MRRTLQQAGIFALAAMVVALFAHHQAGGGHSGTNPTPWSSAGEVPPARQ